MLCTDRETYLNKFDQKQEDVYNYRPKEIKKQHSRLLHVIIYQIQLNLVSQVDVSGLADLT